MDATDRNDAIFRAIKGLAPRGYWPCQETYGTTIKDASGNALDLTATSATLGTLGPADGVRAIKFDGSASKLTRADENNLDLTSALSVLAFCSFTNVGGNAEVTSKATSSSSDSLRLTLVTTASPNYIQLGYGGTVANEKAAGDVAEPITARWMLIAGSVAGSATGTTYKDARPAPSYTNGRITAPATLANTSNAFEVGFGTIFGRFFTGSICHVAIFPAVLADIAYKNIFQAAFG